MNYKSRNKVAENTLEIFEAQQIGVKIWRQCLFCWRNTKGSLICSSENKPHVFYGYHTVAKIIEELNDNSALPKSIRIG